MMASIGCKSAYKKCNCESNNEELVAYSEILNELVEHSFYNFYLGADEERIFKEYAKAPSDTVRIDREIVRLQNKIFNDTGRFCTVYLDTTASKFNRMSGLQKDTSNYTMQFRKLIQDVSDLSTSLCDTLGSIQTRYLPKDFILCTSKIKILSNNKSDSNACLIGKVRLSKIFFNPSMDKGIMYYEFVCGGLCGHGNVILMEKLKGRWVITKRKMIWIS
ncbi:MAG TPA: hypothetical protein VHD83_10005 [Puia sp.]|nr:hypothetical protein [Puia sp.]